MTSYEDEYDDEEDPPVSQAKVLSLRVDGATLPLVVGEHVFSAPSGLAKAAASDWAAAGFAELAAAYSASA